MRPVGLEYLSVFGMHPARYVELAARVGYCAVGLNLGGAANSIGEAPRFDLRQDSRLRSELADSLRASEIGLSLLEGFAILPDADVEQFCDHLDWAGGLGTRAICAVSLERDRSRSRDQFARLTELASQRGIRTTTEVGAGILKNLPRALDMIRSVDIQDFTLLIDAMHFFRSGGTCGDLETVEPSLIGHVQICDVPMPATISDYMEEALTERRVPGDGDLPLADFARRLPADVPVGLEIPVRSRLDRGAVSEAFLRHCLQRARDLMP